MIQPYSLGTSVTRLDGGNIATGTINAQDAVIAGSLTADRVNASSFQGNTLFIQSMVNGINSGSTRIDGATIQTGSLSAAQIRLSPASLVIDPDFSQGTAGWSGFIQRLPANNGSVPSGCPGAYAAQFGSRDCPPTYGIRTKFDEKYQVTMWGNNGGGSGGGGIGILVFELNSIGTVIDAYSIGNSTANGWINLVAEVAPRQAAAVELRIGPWMDKPVFVGNAWFTGLSVTRKTDASLIVNGSVTAASIVGGGISADTLIAGIISAAKLDIAGILTVGNVAAAVNNTSAANNIAAQINTGTVTRITGTGISTGAITAAKLESTLILASTIQGGYSENGSRVPTAGFRLRHDDPDGYQLKVGSGWFGTTIKIGNSGYTFGDLSGRALSAIGATGVGANDAVWYRGNNTGGVPVIADNDTNPSSNPRLLINSLCAINLGGPSYPASTQLSFRVQPYGLSDNLDGLRYIEVEVWHKSGTAMVKLMDYFPLPITDRRYEDPINSTAASNCAGTSWTFTALDYGCTSTYTYPLILKCRIVNVTGKSTEHYFTAPSATGSGNTSATGRWTDCGTTPPATGGTAGSGGGGSNTDTCPWVETSVMMSNQTQKRLGDLLEGDWVWSRQENGGQWAARQVTAISFHKAECLSVNFTDGTSLVATPNHRIETNECWTEIQTLKPGTVITGMIPKVVREVISVGIKEIAMVTVDEFHTYVTNGALSHNMKVRP